MIYQGGKSITQIWHNSRTVATIYYYGRIIWQAIRSCFGTGVWKSDKPWVGDDKWKSNK